LPLLSATLVSTIPIYFGDYQSESTHWNLDVTCAVVRAPMLPLSVAPL
jgi:hypothetical protein